MAEIIKMPKLSDTMTEGVLVEWHKNVGDTVESGELLAEIETDKATMEFESFFDGVILHIGVQKGETTPVDALLCVVGEKGEDVEAILKEASQTSAPTEAETKEEVKVEAPAPVTQKEVSKPSPAPTPVAVVTSASDSSDDSRVKASPLARRLASEQGIPLNQVNGSGEGGRIVKRDIDNYRPGFGAVNSNAQLSEKYTEEGVSQMRKTIARRLGESKFSAPHFYLTMEVDMDNAISSRKALIEQTGSKISFNDIIVKACAMALKKHPKVNSSWLEDRIRYNEHVNIGVAVAVDEGLLVPVVRYADSKSFAQINVEVKEFAKRARDKKLQPEDWEGNTFTISNLGMFGIEEFTAIINSPDACILAVGGIKQVPVVKNGAVVPGNTMKLTLSCDHRVVDGVVGSEFLQTLKAMIENPVLIFM